MQSLLKLLESHRALYHRLDVEGDEQFVSDWNGSHPYVEDYLGNLSALGDEHVSPRDYLLLEYQEELTDRLTDFHRTVDGRPDLESGNILPGNGSTALLSALCLWLLAQDQKEVLYIRPLYYTLAFLFKLLGIRARPVSGRQPFQTDFRMNLPDNPSVLIITDPIWYAGLYYQKDIIDRIAAWQKLTGSWVLVDGSFQYMSWAETHIEHTSKLDIDRTLRLICFSKALSIHGFRFAHLVLPKSAHRPLGEIYESLHGASSIGDVLFAKRAAGTMLSASRNRKLLEFIQRQFGELRDSGHLDDFIYPECGYFAFVKPRRSLEMLHTMGAAHFGLDDRLEGFVRINLLNERSIRLVSKR